MLFIPTALCLSALVGCAQGLSIDVTSSDSICSAASTVAAGLMDYYSGTKDGGTVGYFDGDYYWWEYAEAFHALLDYTYLCGDDQYLSDVREGIISQLGDDDDFYPAAQTQNIGNDDQTFWGLLALNAYERGLEAPSESLSWLDAAQNVYDAVEGRWDNSTCSGGVRWQILANHSGYDYKNSITNGNLMLIAAQLYKITGEDEYLTTAEKIWDWLTGVGYVKDDDSGVLSVYDGANDDDSCSDLTKSQWSYNYGTMLGGLSYLYNTTHDTKWANLTSEMLIGVETFFDDDEVMYERTCQGTNTCDEDERCFKSILTRNMAAATNLYPTLEDKIDDYLSASAKSAAQSCSGGSDNVTCGLDWSYDGWDGQYGIGEQMNALAIFVSLLD